MALLTASEQQEQRQQRRPETSRYLVDLKTLATTPLQKRLLKKMGIRRVKLQRQDRQPKVEANPFQKSPEAKSEFIRAAPKGYCNAKIWDPKRNEPMVNLAPKHFKIVSESEQVLKCLSHIGERVTFSLSHGDEDLVSDCGQYVVLLQ
jgi:hypothetical protein